MTSSSAMPQLRISETVIPDQPERVTRLVEWLAGKAAKGPFHYPTRSNGLVYTLAKGKVGGVNESTRQSDRTYLGT